MTILRTLLFSVFLLSGLPVIAQVSDSASTQPLKPVPVVKHAQRTAKMSTRRVKSSVHRATRSKHGRRR